jgi:hypothetical protein
LNLPKVTNQTPEFVPILVQQTIAWFEVPVDVVRMMEMGQSRGDVFEEGIDLFER